LVGAGTKRLLRGARGQHEDREKVERTHRWQGGLKRSRRMSARPDTAARKPAQAARSAFAPLNIEACSWWRSSSL
jgi:hypothetical protein